jgi:hypothetical protein
VEHFAWEWDDPRTPEEVLDRVTQDDLLLRLSDKGYVAYEGESSVAFTRTYRDPWVWIVGIATFPIGLILIALLTKKGTFTFNAAPNGAGSLVRAEGQGNEAARQIIATVYQEVAVEARAAA